MPDEQQEYNAQDRYEVVAEEQRKRRQEQKYLLHIGLFLITFLTTTIAGTDWTTGRLGEFQSDWRYYLIGLPYSISILFVITCHEFGHYFAARHHKVRATLPYYIPFPPIPMFLNFGTMGAVIRTKSIVPSKKAMFDIGAAGPLAGFIACLILLIYGFLNVPGKEYILKIHPDYFSPSFGKGGLDLQFGDTLLFSILKFLFVREGQFFPPMSEIYHYPFLCVGWFGLFITAMNMIPVGQLDGGHISYTMFGRKNHMKIAVISFIILFVIGILGFADSTLKLGIGFGWTGWLFWAVILYLIIKLQHPPVYDETGLDPKRKILGYICFIIFGLSFSPTPFILTFSS
ncbi:MAG TPA: site-2 protease family protein [Ignavibacteriaceae bacterium]|nr:site-2 protease family protein [Ignavibacteriaceae bacterium]